jgi:hypothetical protein
MLREITFGCDSGDGCRMRPTYCTRLALLPLALLVLALAPGASAAQAAEIVPARLSEDASTIVAGVARQWTHHELGDGRLVDRFFGPIGKGYGGAMIGQAMVETGALSGAQSLIEDGISSELSGIADPSDGSFEVLALSDAVIWNNRHLASNPAWQAAREPIEAFLRGIARFMTATGAHACYRDPRCFSNLKLVTAAGSLDLLRSGLSQPSRGSLLQNKPRLYAAAMRLLTLAQVSTGGDARRLGPDLNFSDAGILSDATRNPLAYHVLSATMLGHIMRTWREGLPRGITDAFFRSSRSIVGLMAPDGDVSYIGRGQGQVWTVAAAVDALAIAASATHSAVWRGRYLAACSQALGRLKTTYGLGEWGLPMVPRFAGGGGDDYRGIDGYANTVMYNGLALWALQEAADVLASVPRTKAQFIGGEADGVFIDPSHTAFAAVKKGRLWYVIHAADTKADARYDFGLVAAERESAGLWRTAMPYRPRTVTPASGGPVLDGGLVPVGTSISATPSGVIRVRGGWARTAGAPATVDLGMMWVFKPYGDGVMMSFRAHARRRYRFQVWYELGSEVVRSGSSLVVAEPNGRRERYVFNQAFSVSSGEVDHSAYDADLGSTIITLRPTKHRERITSITEFL